MMQAAVVAEKCDGAAKRTAEHCQPLRSMLRSGLFYEKMKIIPEKTPQTCKNVL